jgi:DNA recombination protein RmuC
MEYGLAIGLGLFSGLLAALAVAFMLSRRSHSASTDDKGVLLLQNQLNELTRTLDQKIGESSKMMFETVRGNATESAKIYSDVVERLARLDETSRQVIDFKEQIQSLQDMLKNPKQRGIVGEYYLETLLKNVLPPGSYQMQYPFPDGTIVDAVVFVKDKIIPIDSKFSLENYNRLTEIRDDAERARLEKVFINDLKNRITETSKYIQPEQGTMEFAFMFIPHEAIYYDLIINKIGALTDDTENLIQRAASKYHVIIVSPTSFLAYLQTVLQGLKALQIEESAKEIRKRVDELGKHLGAYQTYFSKMGASLSTTVNHYNAAGRELGKIDKDVLRVTGASAGIAVEGIEKPGELEEGI